MPPWDLRVVNFDKPIAYIWGRLEISFIWTGSPFCLGFSRFVCCHLLQNSTKICLAIYFLSSLNVTWTYPLLYLAKRYVPYSLLINTIVGGQDEIMLYDKINNWDYVVYQIKKLDTFNNRNAFQINNRRIYWLYWECEYTNNILVFLNWSVCFFN